MKPLVLRTRKEAHRAGFKRFYTGRLCQAGHDSERYVSTGNCCDCISKYSKPYSSSPDQVEFSAKLHPDDLAAARMFCEALNAERRAQLYVLDPVAEREKILARLKPAPVAPYLPKP